MKIKSKSFGCPIHYHAAKNDTARLLAVVGPRRFQALQEAFGGTRLWIPKDGMRISCLTCSNRDRCVRIWRREGRSPVKIAARLGISLKTVYRICAGRGAGSHSRRKRE